MVVSALALIVLLTAAPAERTLRLIGNAGFEITDGSSTLLLDFPYESGAYGYMTFEQSELHARPGSLCLFTHIHADHFKASDVAKIGCRVAGPRQVTTKVDPPLRHPGESPWKLGAATITCLPSEHGDLDHCSFLIDWHGTKMLISGDVDSILPVLEKAPQADLMILSEWLAREVPEIRKRYQGVRILLSHRSLTKPAKTCRGCERPAQGETVAW